jgi:glycerol-3-phosphate cytidylyltransferase
MVKGRAQSCPLRTARWGWSWRVPYGSVGKEADFLCARGASWNQEIKSHKRMKTVITFGTFDLFHVGHLNILMRARSLGERLVVGVSTDELNFNKKNARPIFSQRDRVKIVAGLRCVDVVFLEESLEAKRDYILAHRANVLVMGDDWAGRFDFLADICEVRYLTRTPKVSSTDIKLDVVRRALLDPPTATSAAA